MLKINEQSQLVIPLMPVNNIVYPTDRGNDRRNEEEKKMFPSQVRDLYSNPADRFARARETDIQVIA